MPINVIHKDKANKETNKQTCIGSFLINNSINE